MSLTAHLGKVDYTEKWNELYDFLKKQKKIASRFSRHRALIRRELGPLACERAACGKITVINLWKEKSHV